MSVFEQYAPFIQDFIFQNRWDSLRAVQVAAGEAIFGSEDNVLLCASTASGKTEAAFFPILTLLQRQPSASVGALYIGPLKALINDQFYRLEALCSEGGIPVHAWHGDISRSRKQKLLQRPEGILQITPESLEAMLLHRHGDISRLFGDLRFVVIDELHALLRADRGGQTLCLLQRLCALAGCDPRRIGLSATLGDPETAGHFLCAGSSRGLRIPRMESTGLRWHLSMDHFYTNEPAGGRQGPAPRSDTAPPAADAGYGYVFEHCRDKKCLVFVNSREECEAVTTTLRSYCEATAQPDRFLIHHGNLSASLRQTAEEQMRDEERTLSAVTTATLELGIDIGRLERAFQLEAPFTVSAFLQRMGRTGRRGQPPEMWFVMREEPPEPRADLPETLPWPLLQGIALVQSYAEDGFVEPARTDRLPFSLLYHQTMSILGGAGELTPAGLAARVLSLAVFGRITREQLRTLLLHLINIDHIQRTEEGGLIVGLAGERQLGSFRFYSVFTESEEYTVRAEQGELGTVVMPPPVGEKLAIAGHVWLVEQVDHRRRLVYATQVHGKVPAYFGQCAGDVHGHVLEKLRQVLTCDTVYPYLRPAAAARLALARDSARRAGLHTSPLVCLGGDCWCLFPFLGSYAHLALERFLKLRCGTALGLSGLDSVRPYYIRFRMQADAPTFFATLRQEADRPLDPMELVYPGEVPHFEKYDEFVPPELLRYGFAHGVLDVRGMLERIRTWST